MSHVDQQVVDAVTTLVTGLTTSGNRVFKDHIYPFAESDLPCLSVTSADERVEYLTVHKPRMEAKTISISIDAIAKANASMMATLRGMRKEVEIVLATNQGINGLARASRLTGTITRQDVTGDQPVGVATMTYEIDVYCLETTPDTAI